MDYDDLTQKQILETLERYSLIEDRADYIARKYKRKAKYTGWTEKICFEETDLTDPDNATFEISGTDACMGDSWSWSAKLPFRWLFLDDDELDAAIDTYIAEQKAAAEREKEEKRAAARKAQEERDRAQYEKLQAKFGGDA